MRKINVIENKTRKGTHTFATCPLCTRSFESHLMNAVFDASRSNKNDDKNGYLCVDCSDRNLPYSTKNDKVYGDDSYTDYFGIEWETNGTTLEARHMFIRFGFIPTSDSSLDDDDLGGKAHLYKSGDWSNRTQYSCEYKSALMRGRKALTKQAIEFEEFLNGGHIASDDSCGTHTHISINGTNDMEKTIRFIRRNAYDIIRPMEEVMRANPRKVEKLFGRNFTYYASTMDYSSLYDHCNWINLSKDTDVEFRLNKFVSADQFLKCVDFEYKMLQYIVDSIEKGISPSKIGRQLATRMKKALG